MKKLLLLFFLVTNSLGYSQTLRLGFESGESGNAFGAFGGFSILPAETGTGSNTSKVLPIVANPGGQIWQGCNFVLTTPVQLTTTKTMTIDVLSSTPVTFLMKVNGGVAGAPAAAAQASHNGDGTWQTISFTFNTALDGQAASANGVYNNMVIHPFFPFSGPASARTFYIDNISGPQALVAPTLSNFSISTKTVGDSFELTAPTSNSAGAFTYTSSNPSVATISGSTVNAVGAGNTTITATQAANGSYLEGSITATFTVSNLIIPTINALTLPTVAMGDAPFSLTDPISNSSGAFTYTSSNPSVATISGSTVTIVGVGTTTITATQVAVGSYDTGSVSATLTVNIPSATIPTKAAEDVISIYSDTYSNVTGTDFYPNWGQSTQFAVFNTSGNPTLRYSNLNYQGNQFSPAINASSMQNLHIDIWTPNCTSFQLFLINQGIGEQAVTLTPTLSGWNSFDIPLSSYTNINKANIGQFKYVGTTGSTVYLDNIYFWKAPVGTFTYYADTDNDGYGAGAAVLLQSATAPTGYSVNSTDCNDSSAAMNPGATEIADGLDNDCDGAIDEGFPPSIAAPTPPARNAWDVVSLFSGAYNNVTLNELPTSWSQLAVAPFTVETIAGNATWKFGGEFLGMVTNYGSGINLSQMTTMHIDYWTPDNKIMIAKLVNTIDGGEGLTIVQDPVVTGTWRSVDIPMSQFGTSLNKSKITQILLDPQLGGSTVYVDNFYFYRPESSQPSPTITNFSIPSKNIDDAAFTITPPTSNSPGSFTYTSSNTAVASISGDEITIEGGGTTIITATQAAAGGFGPGTITASFVVSFPPPATAAPTPTVPADRVLSVFSNAYTNEGGASYPYWGQPAGYIAPAVVQIETNNTLKLDNLTYQGVQLASTIDVSSMTTLHVDIWTPNCTSFDFFLIDSAPVGVPPAEQKVTVSLTQSGWNSIDIPMSSYNTLALTAVQQFKLVGTPAGSIVYLDNIYFTKPTPTSVAPTTTAVVNYCKGVVASPLTASGFSGNTLKWYTGTTNATTGITTYGASSSTAPTPSTSTTGTKKYQVSQVLSNGSESPRATITVNVLALPTEVLGTITSNTESTVTPGTYLAATTAVGQFVGTSNTVTYRVPAFVGTGLTYYWTVPTGVNIVSQTENTVTVNFLNVPSGIGAVGAITVQAQNANGCRTAAKSVALTKVLPTAPSAIKMFDDTLPVNATTLLPVAVTSFGRYMGTNRVLRLVATPSLTATSYIWELPEGVNQLSGGTTNEITVNFSGVTSENTHTLTTATALTKVLRIGVKSRNGVGQSTTNNSVLTEPTTTSTAKLLTLKATLPSAVSAVSGQISGICGGSTYNYTITPNALASSYIITAPTGSVVTSASNSSNTLNELATSDLTFSVTYPNGFVGNTTLSPKTVTITSVNGVGNSLANRTLVIASTMSSVGTVTGSAGIASFTRCATQTFTIPAVVGATNYVWTPANGAVIVSGQGTTSVTVDFSAVSGTVTSTKLTVVARNLCNVSSAIKSITLASTACPVAVKMAAPTSSVVSMYPNPARDNFTLELTSSQVGEMSMTIYNINGVEIRTKNVQLTEGTNIINEDVSSLSSGIYFVQIYNTSNNETFVKKLVKE